MKLKYLPAGLIGGHNAQPCVVVPDEGKPIRVVPITPFVSTGTVHECVGCIGEEETYMGQRINCSNLPNCDDAIFVRATMKNKLKYVEWLLNKHN